MKISKTRDVKTPTRGTKNSSGIDFYVPNDIGWDNKTLSPGESISISSGIKCKIPDGFALIAFNKSGISLNQGLQVGACVIDVDYQGEIHLHVFNYSNLNQTIKSGQKLVQFILIPNLIKDLEIVPENELFELNTERGQNGFGSTGIQ